MAFAHAIKIGIFTEAEANEVEELLEYRNHIAHRIHLVMSDVSRSYFVDGPLVVHRADLQGGRVGSAAQIRAVAVGADPSADPGALQGWDVVRVCRTSVRG